MFPPQKNRNRNGHLHDRAARRSGLLDLLCASNYVKLAGVSVLHPSAFLSSQSSLWYAWCTIGFALSDWTRSCGLHSLGVPDSHPRSQVIRPLPSHNMSSSPLSNCWSRYRCPRSVWSVVEFWNIVVPHLIPILPIQMESKGFFRVMAWQVRFSAI